MKKIACFISLTLLVFTAASSFKVEAATGYINGPSYIQKEQYSILSLSDILSFYNSDLGVSIAEDNYSGNGATIGIHTLTLNSGSTLKTVEIEVLPTIGYGVRAVTDKKNIHINKSNKLSPIDIANIHGKTGIVDLNYTSQMSVLTDQYSASYNQPGSYTFEYRLLDAAGYDITIGATITVYESDRLENPILIKPASPNVFDSVTKVIGSAATVLLIVGVIYLVVKAKRRVRK